MEYTRETHLDDIFIKGATLYSLKKNVELLSYKDFANMRGSLFIV